MGVLFHTDKENQQFWVSDHPLHTPDFFYGFLFMIPALFLFDFKIGLERFADMTYLWSIPDNILKCRELGRQNRMGCYQKEEKSSKKKED